MGTPHVRLTVNDLKEQYKRGYLTVKGYIVNYLLASRKRGWRLRIDSIQDFCKELGISKSSFYRAIGELKSEPGSTFHFEVKGSMEIWLEEPSQIQDTESQVWDTESQIWDTESQVWDTESQVWDTESQIWDKRDPKALPCKASRAPSTLYSSNTSSLQATAAKKNEPKELAKQFRRLAELAKALAGRKEDPPLAKRKEDLPKPQPLAKRKEDLPRPPQAMQPLGDLLSHYQKDAPDPK